ncbi:MAG: type 2 lanthipeptide synthetase LanM family protein [Rivularia sp. (in: cyanobacteria)]
MLATEHPKLESYLRTLVEKASFLTERLNEEFISTPNKSDESKVNSHLKFWCEVLARGDESLFQQRLAADGLDVDTLHTLLGKVEYPQSQPLPSWTQTLKLILQAAEKTFNTNTFSENQIPFEPFYQPFIEVAQNLLLSRINLNILSEEAQKSLWRSLIERLRNIATPTLFAEFHQFRSSGNPLQDFLLIELQGKNSQEKYHAFLQNLSQNGLFDLFDKYPVLGRLLATAIDYWVDATVEFINRLRTDWLAIATLFSPKTALQQVVELKANLSDLHNQGRSVIALTFDTGLKLVYKPKDMEMELAYNKIISWCNERDDLPLSLKTFAVLHQGKYGWVEFVNQYDCDHKAAAERYYTRAGMILAVIHLLLGTDCHYENLIASGEHPVLIDLETLLTHEIRVSHQSNSTVPFAAFDIAQKQLEKSLLRTMLLPQKGLIAKDSVEIDLSGFGGVEEYQSPMLKLNHVNTDGMNIGYEVVSVESNPNTPKVNGVNLSPLPYLEKLVAGFEQMYRFFIKHKQSLLQADSPLMGLANQRIRYVFRATYIYHSIIQSSYSPEFLDSGIKRSLGLEVLARAFVVNKTMLHRIGILNAERQAAENGDIPFFTINTSESHLPLPGKKAIGDLFVKPSFDAMLEQMQQLNETDLARQVNVIKGSFAARYTEEPKLPKNSFPITNGGENSIDIDIDSHIFVKQAINLAEELKQKAIFGEDGSVCWLGLSYKTTTEGFLFQPLGSNLYDGNCGIALFLAALAKITGDSQWSDLALSSLKSTLQLQQIQSSSETARLLRKTRIGGATGLASMAYSLVHISKFLADDGLLTTAKKIALLITPQLIASEKYLDITRGVAGTILGLLAVYKNSPDDSLLNLAINCGEHLLEQQVSIDGSKTWQTWNGIALTGFSQGISGIADALLRLWEITGGEDFLQAAQAAISNESSYFSQEAGNWQDLRPQTPDYQLSWSHGAAGIVLARLQHQHKHNNSQVSEEVNIALETIQKYGIWGIDNLAWGNFGRIETLLVASQILKRPELLQLARSWSIKLIEQAGAKGNFTLYENIISPVHNPAFLHGTSGIGYQLLRLAYPELPSILSFDF